MAEISVGVACLALGGAAVALPLLRPDAPDAPVATASATPAELDVADVGQSEQPEPAVTKAAGKSKYTSESAVAYFNEHWSDKTNGRVTDIRTTGRYLRIYTNLPESANNSKTALRLCERGLLYLASTGERDPVVFVQAEFGENGNPVLANILGRDDRDCRVTHPEPRS
ncbi:hypothetical protein Aph01nite_51690 [Acrocarpospora phusangensis]|uniref:Uncharacterized protein n=1 Tax=Acrocarpospora phusangensis TaxID=1070424 RepID=A0A919QFH1_9ACTN|nr:hypothetical protein [Acrocarpospora phusangensis]GIH26859.1 hypothetical protein Aph01nite_51690 [Acrocarpospora phusangensis]